MAVEVLPKDVHNGRLVANVHPPDSIVKLPTMHARNLKTGLKLAALTVAFFLQA